MKNIADKRRTKRTFELGDEVFVKLQPYAQMTAALRVNHKLSFCYFGPYKIIAKINPVAYEVQIPPESKIHHVFHVT
jgi:hypothetical protein